MNRVAHVWSPGGRSLCEADRTDDPVVLRPPDDRDENATTCPGCVIAVEIYIAAVRGTIIATSAPSVGAEEAVRGLVGTAWSNVVSLDDLSAQVRDGRGLRMYSDTQWGPTP